MVCDDYAATIPGSNYWEAKKLSGLEFAQARFGGALPTGQNATLEMAEARYRTAGILVEELLGLNLLPVTNTIKKQQTELAQAIWAVFQINDLSVAANAYQINPAYNNMNDKYNAFTKGLPSNGATVADVRARIFTAYSNRTTFDLSRLEIYTPVPYRAPVGDVVSQELLRIRVPEGQVTALLVLNMALLGLLGFAFRRRIN
jgi:hypothetical protein